MFMGEKTRLVRINKTRLLPKLIRNHTDNPNKLEHRILRLV